MKKLIIILILAVFVFAGCKPRMVSKLEEASEKLYINNMLTSDNSNKYKRIILDIGLVETSVASTISRCNKWLTEFDKDSPEYKKTLEELQELRDYYPGYYKRVYRFVLWSKRLKVLYKDFYIRDIIEIIYLRQQSNKSLLFEINS